MKKESGEPTNTKSFFITLRGEEKELFDKYMYTHIVNTGEITISAATLARRMIIEFILSRSSELRTAPLTLDKVNADKKNILGKK